MNPKTYLIQQLSEALAAAGLPDSSPQVTPTRDPKFGHLSTNLPLTLVKQLKTKPLEIADQILAAFQYDAAMIKEVTVSAPGFINFFISDDYYRNQIRLILDNDEHYSCGSSGTGKTANVEFVSANPTGPLTVGHGRQAVLGDTVASILNWHGYQVTREYYYNDAGRQMRLLGQSVAARYYQELGQPVELPEVRKPL